MTRNSHKLLLFPGLLTTLALACSQSAAPSITTEIIQSPNPSIAPETVGSFQPQVSGDTSHSINFGGQERTYLVHIPAGYDPTQPSPLVLVFHGFSLNAEEMVRITGFNTQADAEGFVVVYPNGSGKKSSWNGGDCCGEAQVKNVDDVGFVRALIEELSSWINIDRKRVYATGFSNGAIMVYRLACELSDQIAAIAPVGATQDFPQCQPGRPVSVLHFHGTNDQLNPYEGGVNQTGTVDFLPVKDSIQFWVVENGCPPEAQKDESGNIVHEEFSPCEQGTAVELYTIVAGEHAWPGGESVSSEVGEPTKEIYATPIMWEFFVDHPLP